MRRFFKKMLSLVIKKLVSKRSSNVPPLLKKFNGAYVSDCTTVPLSPSLAEQYPGCGGKTEKSCTASVKIFLRTEITTGNTTDILIDAGKTSDHTFIEKASKLPAGSLELLDLGFTDFKRLKENDNSNIYYITRVQTNNKITVDGETYDLPTFFSQHKRKDFDIRCELGVDQFPVRLVAIPAPQSVANRRLKDLDKTAQKNSRTVSDGQKTLTHWTFYFTNIPESMCSLADIFALYTVRWQIELVFKLWKDKGGLDESYSTSTTTGKKSYRSICEALIKLLGLIICNWFMLERGGRLCGISAMERFQYVHERMPKILYAVQKNKLSEIRREIRQLLKRLDELSPPNTSKKKISTYKLLFNPQLYHVKYTYLLS